MARIRLAISLIVGLLEIVKSTETNQKENTKGSFLSFDFTSNDVGPIVFRAFG